MFSGLNNFIKYILPNNPERTPTIALNKSISTGFTNTWKND